MHHYYIPSAEKERLGGGEEGEGYEVRETADRGGARMGRVEDL